MDWFKGPLDCRGDLSRRPQEYHRLRAVREKLGLRIEDVADELGLSVADASLQEDPRTDLNLTQIHRWQSVLKVPFREILICEKDPMALPGLTVERLNDMNRMAEDMCSGTSDSGVATFAAELSRQFGQILDSAEQPFVAAHLEEGNSEAEDEIETEDEGPATDVNFSAEAAKHPGEAKADRVSFFAFRPRLAGQRIGVTKSQLNS